MGAPDEDDDRTVAERAARPSPPVDDEATQVDPRPPKAPSAPGPGSPQADDDEATRIKAQGPGAAAPPAPRRPLVQSAAQSLRRFTGELRAIANPQAATPGERRKFVLLLALVALLLVVGLTQVVLALTTDHPEVARPLGDGPAPEEKGRLERLFDW